MNELRIVIVGTQMPRDSFNRELDYLRISVIDRCNVRCVYCMPLNGLRFLPKAELPASNRENNVPA